MGDLISNWILEHMPLTVKVVGSLSSEGVIIFSFVLLAVFCFGYTGLCMLIQSIKANGLRAFAIKRVKRPKSCRGAKRRVRSELNYIKRFLDDDEEYDDEWMDYEAYVRTR